MANFLLKTEPSTYSFSQLARQGRTAWDGITNPAALKYLRSARVGDQAVIYHTGNEKAAVGIAEIVGAPYPDPKNDRLWIVDLEAREELKRTVALAELKADAAFADSPLVRQGRLSFVPLTPQQWKRLLQLSAG